MNKIVFATFKSTKQAPQTLETDHTVCQCAFQNGRTCEHVLLGRRVGRRDVLPIQTLPKLNHTESFFIFNFSAAMMIYAHKHN